MHILRLIVATALVGSLVACAPTPPPSCRGVVFHMNPDMAPTPLAPTGTGAPVT